MPTREIGRRQDLARFDIHWSGSSQARRRNCVPGEASLRNQLVEFALGLIKRYLGRLVRVCRILGIRDHSASIVHDSDLDVGPADINANK